MQSTKYQVIFFKRRYKMGAAIKLMQMLSSLWGWCSWSGAWCPTCATCCGPSWCPAPGPRCASWWLSPTCPSPSPSSSFIWLTPGPKGEFFWLSVSGRFLSNLDDNLCKWTTLPLFNTRRKLNSYETDTFQSVLFSGLLGVHHDTSRERNSWSYQVRLLNSDNTQDGK